GHTAYGRYAQGRGVNAASLVPQGTDAASGALAYQGANAKLAKGTSAMELFQEQRGKNQHDRGIAQVIPPSALVARGGAAKPGGAGHAPLHREPAAAPEHVDVSAGHFAAGPGAEVQDPSMTRLGTNTEPKARPPGWQPPAHAITAFEPELK